MNKRLQIASLIVIVALGFILRLRGLSRVGFNEDEVQKVNAARQYLQGNFSVNLEHPMLMKSMIAVSLAATDLWNRELGGSRPVPEEVAVRLPNVIFGALTAVVLFLVAQEFFSGEIGLLAAFLWSVGTLAIMDNRLAKEDTLLVFFTWLGYYFYRRAKKVAAGDPQRAEKHYLASGASFGLMLASKYFPHYLGLNLLYYYLCGDKQVYPPRRKRDTILLLGVCALFFVLFNPLVLVPSTLKYILHYAGEGTMTHHGYLMMGHFYYNDPAHLRGGMPIYFYPLLLAVKTPLPVLGAFLVGLIEVWGRRREPGPSFVLFMFLFWIVPFSLLSAKWLRYMLAWMPSVYMIAAVGLARILSWSFGLTKGLNRRWLVPAMAGSLAVVFLLGSAWVSARSRPYYSLYLNALGGGRTGYYFPHDEVNDMGLREAIGQICEDAPQGAMVGGETQPVFDYYFHQFGRDDLHYFDLSSQADRAAAPPSAYVVVQDGRKYFENVSFVEKVESYQMPIETVEIGGAAAVRVYRDEQFAKLGGGPMRKTLRYLRPLASIASLALFVYALRRTGIANILDGARALGAGFVWLILLSGLRHALRTAAWHGSIEPDTRPGLLNLFALRLVGEGLNVATPAGPLLGESVKVWAASRHMPGSSSASSVVIENIVYGLGAGLFMVGGSVLVLLAISPHARLGSWIAVTCLTVCLLIPYALLRRGSPVMARLLDRLQAGSRTKRFLGAYEARIKAVEVEVRVL